MLESSFNRLAGFRTSNFLKKREVFSCEYCQIFRTLILMKICEQSLLPFRLLTVNISPQGLVSALNSIGLHQRSSSMFKEFSLGCLVKWSLVVPLVITRCTTRLSFYKRSARLIFEAKSGLQLK